MADLREAYQGRRVLVTGHTGFKGAWLSQWLLQLGADVAGAALEPPTDPSLFEILGLRDRMDHGLVDVRDSAALSDRVRSWRPEIVFHLAAQPLVRESYREPVGTWETNVGGTLNLLECLRRHPGVRACVVVTSDKCYEQRGAGRAFREDDAMGGADPYSASKGAVELLVASYRRSYFGDPDGLRLASARAGNVIGGGDWARDRLVADLVRSLQADEPLRLRFPRATRPWQHVLEPLSGYLLLGASLLGAEGQRWSEGWNFGPPDSSCIPVGDLARRLVAAMGRGRVVDESVDADLHEAATLALDCSKAEGRLGWTPVWDLDQTIGRLVEWFKEFEAGADMVAVTCRQIGSYSGAIADRGAGGGEAG